MPAVRRADPDRRPGSHTHPAVAAPQHAGPMTPVISALLSKAPSLRPDSATLTRQLTELLRPSPPVLTVRSSSTPQPTEPATTVSAAHPAHYFATLAPDAVAGRQEAIPRAILS
jgi:eukaryotic-like serine/threonine-protein kinase